MIANLAARFAPRLQTRQNYPGWDAAPAFIESVIADNRYQRVADLGGGANPVVSRLFAEQANLDYCLLDISAAELQKASTHYSEKFCVDVATDTQQFLEVVRKRDFDLVFSHMFLEHVHDPVQVHRNIHAMLKPQGVAIHFYPTPYNVPLGLNNILPGWLTRAMVRIAQPNRDLDGNYGKFPAYYRMCGNPSSSLRRVFESLGYDVLVHSGFVGHNYYDRFPLAMKFELALRPMLVNLGIGMTTAQLLILQKK